MCVTKDYSGRKLCTAHIEADREKSAKERQVPERKKDWEKHTCRLLL